MFVISVCRKLSAHLLCAGVCIDLCMYIESLVTFWLYGLHRVSCVSHFLQKAFISFDSQIVFSFSLNFLVENIKFIVNSQVYNQKKKMEVDEDDIEQPSSSDNKATKKRFEVKKVKKKKKQKSPLKNP